MNKNAKLELLGSFYRSKGLDLNWNEIETLQNCARRAQKNAENYCNGVIGADRYNRLTDIIKDRLKFNLSFDKKGIRFEIQGDPRGCCLSIETNSGALIHPHFFN